MTTVTTPPRTPTRAPKRSSVVRMTRSRTALELKMFFRERDSVVFTFLFPIIMLALFAVAISGGEDIQLSTGGTISFAHYFLPGMAAAGIALSSFQTLGVEIAVERDEGTLKRLRGTPLTPLAYFLGKIGKVLITGLVQIALLLAVAALAFGVDLPTDPDRWLTFAWVYALGTAAGTTLGIAYSSVPTSARSASAAVLGPLLILQFISGVFFVFHELPEWLQNIASVFPLKWIAQGMRSVFLPDSLETLEPAGSWQHLPIAAILAGWTVIGLVLCVRTFRWSRKGDG